MNYTSDATEIETLFRTFLNECLVQDKDIEYCLLQSTVEPTIRFKFGSWLSNKLGDRITLNLMEANRLDLVIGVDKKVYFIEFGHLLNLLQHGADLNNWKVNSDKEKLEVKAKKLISKIERIENGTYKNFFLDKQKIFVVCSLFSDIKVRDNNMHFKTSVDLSRLMSGTLFKYGKFFSPKGSKEYFTNYNMHINNAYKKEEQKYLTGYTEVPIIHGQVSLHYKFDYF